MQKAYCRFLKNDGYCAKGKHCEFSHDKTSASIPCKFFSQSGTCRFGKACTFAHTTSSSKVQSSGSQLYTATVKSIAKADSEAKPQSNVKESPSTRLLWGFDEHQEESVYFYGAPGTFDLKETDSNGSYAAVAKSNVDIQDNSIATQNHVTSSKSHEKNIICSFYLAGNCRYGSFCRNSHDVEVNGDDVVEQPECGICLSIPENQQYGMLNNCNCSFCLNCIRNWRKEGLEVAKENELVRLCPLCRNESHFICPSSRILKGEAKIKALEAYKALLKTIPCKHYQQGSCPFGSSCFYHHISLDGIEEVTVAPRVVLNAFNEIQYRGNLIPISDFILNP